MARGGRGAFWGCLFPLSACFKPKRGGEGQSDRKSLFDLCFCLFVSGQSSGSGARLACVGLG